jgi:hypothetical protein
MTGTITLLNPDSDLCYHLDSMTPRCIAKLRPAAERANLFGGD